MWQTSDILSHPAMDLSLAQLKKERAGIIAFNKKVSAPDYIFKGKIKPLSLQGINTFIKVKEQGIQLKLEI